jgi:hypothetical protein
VSNGLRSGRETTHPEYLEIEENISCGGCGVDGDTRLIPDRVYGRDGSATPA